MGWRQVEPRVNISSDSHYQLANRLAFTWRLATLGIPVVLVYLGFTGDEGIRNVGRPFSSDAGWQEAFREYADSSFPVDMLGKRFEFLGTPVWVVSKSRTVLSISAPPP